MKAAEDEPLSFPIFISAGDVIILGQVASASAFYASTKSAAARNADSRASGGWGSRANQRREEANTTLDQFSQVMDWVKGVEEADADEVTLINASVISRDGSGVRLAALRVPLASVDAWWIASGSEIKSSAGGFFAVGVTVPID